MLDRVVNLFISVQSGSSVGGLLVYSMAYTQIVTLQRQGQDAHLLELVFREGYWLVANVLNAV